MGTVRLFRVQQSRNRIGPNRTLTSPSPQASCLSSLRWQQTAPAFAIFLVKAISSGEVSWGAFFVYATRNLKEAFSTKSCWVLHLFLDPHAFSKTLFWHQKAWIQLIYFIHMVPGPVLGTHSLWRSLPALLLQQQIPMGKWTLGSRLTLFPPSKVSLKWTLIFWCFNFMIEGVSLAQKSAWFGQPKARLWKPSLQAICCSFREGPGEGHLLEQKTGFWTVELGGYCPWGRKNSDMTERLSCILLCACVIMSLTVFPSMDF